MIELDITIFILLFLVAILAGLLDAIAGGGGLITIPILMASGLNPLQALATNKLQGTFGSFSATVHFIRQGYIDFNSMRLAILTTALGAVMGAALVQTINLDFLTLLMPVLLIIFAIYFLCSPNVGDIKQQAKLTIPAFAWFIGFSVGFYDGFFGPGTGSFFMVAFVTLLGYSLTTATAHTKLLNFTSNISSLIIFILSGQIIWLLGLVMGAGQMIGAYIGAHLVIAKGSRLVKPCIVSASLIISFKMIYDLYIK